MLFFKKIRRGFVFESKDNAEALVDIINMNGVAKVLEYKPFEFNAFGEKFFSGWNVIVEFDDFMKEMNFKKRFKNLILSEKVEVVLEVK